MQGARVDNIRVEPANVLEILHRLRTGDIAFLTFLDRASDDDDSFEPLVRYLAKSSTHFYNLNDHVARANNKATMHLEFITNGLYAPYTIIISPYNKKRELELSLSEPRGLAGRLSSSRRTRPAGASALSSAQNP